MFCCNDTFQETVPEFHIETIHWLPSPAFSNFSFSSNENSMKFLLWFIAYSIRPESNSFLSFIFLYIYFSILETLKAKGMSPKISVKEAVLELSKIYAMIHGAMVSLMEIPEKSQKMADLFGLKLFHKILWN